MTGPIERIPKVKLCYVVSAPGTAVSFLNGHIEYLSTDFDITVVCKFDGNENKISQKASVKNIGISREVSPLSDLKSIYQLWRFFRKNEFQIVHSVTPKAGLITAISGWLARLPIRIHWYTGQVWVLKSGFRRHTLKSFDRIISFLDTSLLVDSPSQRDFLIEERIVSPSKSQVLGSGSIAGVDTRRFRPNPDARIRIREELAIPNSSASIILFVGRLNHDKGIDTLLTAFNQPQIPESAYLIVVGADEENYLSRIPAILGERYKRFRHVNQSPNPEDYMAAADIFCLPSFREGFGLALIEASACGLPVVCSNVYGLSDAMINGKTGIAINPSNEEELASSLLTLFSDLALSRTMGANGRQYAEDKFQATRLRCFLSRYYAKQLFLRGRSHVYG